VILVGKGDNIKTRGEMAGILLPSRGKTIESAGYVWYEELMIKYVS